MTELQNKFLRLTARFECGDVNLNSATSDVDIELLSKTWGGALPSQLIEIYRLNDGQASDPCASVFLGHALLSAKSALKSYDAKFNYGWDERLTRTPFPPEIHDPRIRQDRGWQTGWLPFAAVPESGDFLFLDYCPLPNGKIGQIVEWWSDDSYGNVIANNLEHLIEITLKMVKDVECGNYGYSGLKYSRLV